MTQAQFSNKCSYNEAKQVSQAAGMFSETDGSSKTDFTQIAHMFDVATRKTKLTDVINTCSTYRHTENITN